MSYKAVSKSKTEYLMRGRKLRLIENTFQNKRKQFAVYIRF